MATLAICGGLPLAAHSGCPAPGEWWQAQLAISNSDLLAQAAQQQVVLLGEQHVVVDHHRWQLSTLAGLYALRDDMIIGLEMLPRSTQPVLDSWITGSLSEQELLEQTQWQEVWGFDPELYLPILHFARLHHIPLIALNITPALRQRLVEEGFENVPAEQRYHIPAPVPPDDSYKARLAEVFARHDTMDQDDPERLNRFIDAQLSWDVAMAHELANAAQNGTLAVGLMGMGHITYSEGVPHQLSGMNIERTFSLLPWEQQDCEVPDAYLADAVFILSPLPEEGPTRSQ
ncbi:ChaN family lipoprotein [Vreelandella olivaria]|uniref:ChaN family lipoprotein n=1 Tax=Vreelandella olivaria TaxID=390919 RepID=UPI00201F8BF6